MIVLPLLSIGKGTQRGKLYSWRLLSWLANFFQNRIDINSQAKILENEFC